MGNYYSLGHTIKQSTLSGWKSVSQGFRQFLESVVMCVFEGCVSKELHSCAVLAWNTSTETPSNCNPNPVNHILSLKMPSNLWGAAFGPHKWLLAPITVVACHFLVLRKMFKQVHTHKDKDKHNCYLWSEEVPPLSSAWLFLCGHPAHWLCMFSGGHTAGVASLEGSDAFHRRKVCELRRLSIGVQLVCSVSLLLQGVSYWEPKHSYL